MRLSLDNKDYLLTYLLTYNRQVSMGRKLLHNRALGIPQCWNVNIQTERMHTELRYEIITGKYLQIQSHCPSLNHFALCRCQTRTPGLGRWLQARYQLSSFFGSPPHFYFRFRLHGHRHGRFCLIFARIAQQLVPDGTNGLSSSKPCVYCRIVRSELKLHSGLFVCIT